LLWEGGLAGTYGPVFIRNVEGFGGGRHRSYIPLRIKEHRDDALSLKAPPLRVCGRKEDLCSALRLLKGRRAGESEGGMYSGERKVVKREKKNRIEPVSTRVAQRKTKGWWKNVGNRKFNG